MSYDVIALDFADEARRARGARDTVRNLLVGAPRVSPAARLVRCREVVHPFQYA